MFLDAPQELMTDKAEESAVGARSQMKRPGKSVVPPPFKRILRMMLLSEKKGSEGASHPRGSAMSLEDELMHMAGDGIPHSPLDSLSRDLTSDSKGGLLHKPGSMHWVGGIITSCLSADDPRVRAMSVSEVLPDKLPMPMEINIEIKEQLKKEIQQFGGHK
ncbi:cancer/testis antigen family 45 member A10-like [Lycaon pictus]